MGRYTIQVGIRAVIARIGVGAKSRTTQRRRVSPAGVLLEVEYCPFFLFPPQYFTRLTALPFHTWMASRVSAQIRHFITEHIWDLRSLVDPALFFFPLFWVCCIHQDGEMSPRECHDILSPSRVGSQ